MYFHDSRCCKKQAILQETSVAVKSWVQQRNTRLFVISSGANSVVVVTRKDFGHDRLMNCLKIQTLTRVSGLSILFLLVLHSVLVLNYNTECLKNYNIATILQIDEQWLILTINHESYLHLLWHYKKKSERKHSDIFKR